MCRESRLGRVRSFENPKIQILEIWDLGEFEGSKIQFLGLGQDQDHDKDQDQNQNHDQD